MKYYTVLTVLFISGCINVPTSGFLQIQPYRQSTENWCWAASLVMVAQYVHSISLTDCEVASALDMFMGGKGLCCAGDNSCNQTRSLMEMMSLMSNVFELNYSFLGRYLSYGEISRHISAGQPILAILSKGDVGHMIAISGYNEFKQIILIDPDSGMHNVDYEKVKHNEKLGNWTSTFIIKSRPHDQPSCSRICNDCQNGVCDMCHIRCIRD